MPSQFSSDLVVLAADKDIEFAMRGVLARPEALGIRTVTRTIYVHPDRDPGCLRRSHDFLRSFSNTFRHAIVVFDREGSGRDDASRTELKADVEDALRKNGWSERAVAIVVDPELEIWVWSESPEVDRVLGWAHRTPDLRTWLSESGYASSGSCKPDRPKEVFNEALRLARKQRSSSLFQQLADSVSLTRCQDTAFTKFRNTLRAWFPSQLDSESWAAEQRP